MEHGDAKNLVSALRDIAKSLSGIHAELKATRTGRGDQRMDERDR